MNNIHIIPKLNIVIKNFDKYCINSLFCEHCGDPLTNYRVQTVGGFDQVSGHPRMRVVTCCPRIWRWIPISESTHSGIEKKIQDSDIVRFSSKDEMDLYLLGQ